MKDQEKQTHYPKPKQASTPVKIPALVSTKGCTDASTPACTMALQKLVLIGEEVGDLRDQVEGLRLKFQQKEDLAIYQDRMIVTLELELDRIIERRAVQNPLWPTIKSKLPRFLRGSNWVQPSPMLKKSTF